jgi:hypothetical protein
MRGHARSAQRCLLLVTFWLVGSCLLRSGPAVAWHGVQDNQSPAALEQMADFELASEGRRACAAGARAKSHITPLAQQTVEEAHGYLETLGQRAQQLHDGQLPSWVGMMHQAIEGQDAVSCFVAWEQVMQEHLDQLGARQKRKRPGGGHTKTELPENI